MVKWSLEEELIKMQKANDRRPVVAIAHKNGKYVKLLLAM
jgi:hypothetical protein